MSRVLALLGLLLAHAACATGQQAQDASGRKHTVDIVVPEFEVKGEDGYVCTTVPLGDMPYKLVGIMPLAEQTVVHHILLYGEIYFSYFAACKGVRQGADGG